jgi:prevent-host-death family protein
MDKRKTYSTYEAKARLSEILRAVRERGESALISYRGEPIAEIRPVEAPDTGLARRVERLERAGVVVRGSRRGALKPLAARAGALERFLAERSE